jgi:hypothetical protein
VLGDWELQLTAKGLYMVIKDREVVVEGHHTISGDQVVLTDEKGKFACTIPPDEPTGTYQWKSEDGRITFSTVEDNCPGRNLVLTAHSLSSK